MLSCKQFAENLQNRQGLHKLFFHSGETRMVKSKVSRVAHKKANSMKRDGARDRMFCQR